MTADELRREVERLKSKGRMVEAGWFEMLILAPPNSTSANMLAALRIAWLSGAAHLYRLLDDKSMVTGDASFVVGKRSDLLDCLDKELRAFDVEMKAALQQHEQKP